MDWLPGGPSVPLTRLPPLIDHVLVKVVSQTPAFVTTVPCIEVFVKVTLVFIQTVVSGEIEKSAVGGVTVVIGSTRASEKPQGLLARTLTKNVFGVVPPVAPQDEVVNV